ncbi:hypothetical protein Tsubulata_019540 [Turnera subulata]|uniref:Clp R domain-containing protein n=1 Tax=Turnera subulata TaxID=218843 RepID=A0A9Q0FBV2_9ROSI|nr:hypothetical protein Tsubulata_019540 [Turnera subulata]
MVTNTLAFFPVSVSTSRNCCGETHHYSSLSPPLSSFPGNKLFTKHSNSGTFLLRCRRSTVAKVLSCFPTEKFSSQKSPRWSASALKSFGLAEVEAFKLQHATTGTESLILGILVEGTSQAAKFLRANGVNIFKVKDGIVNLLGRSDYFFFPSQGCCPLSEQAQRALDLAVEEKLKSGDNEEMTPTDVLLGIWSDTESAGHKILASLGFNDEKAKELVQSSNQDRAFSLK